jgi:hypothetical protein
LNVDKQKSMDRLRTAADASDPCGVVLLEATLDRECLPKLPPALLDRAFSHLSHQLAKAPEDPVYVHVMGMCHFDALGTEKDIAATVKAWQHGADLNFALSIGSLGWLASRGLGMAEDVQLAKQHAQRGANLGYACARCL